MSADRSHIYRGRVRVDADDALSKLAARIAPGSAVLDVGTGAGGLGEFLSQERACGVDGVNRSAAEIEIARPFYRELVQADLERALLSELLPGRHYDWLVFADVLEHLRDPARTLSDACRLLGKNGRVLISVPNVAHAGVIANLLDAEFVYTEEGLLDHTHVRFFTRSSLAALLGECGLAPTAWDAVVKPLDETEFGHRRLDAFPPALRSALLAHPDSFVYQLIAEAGAAQSGSTPVLAPPVPPAELRFVMQLYQAGPAEDYTEGRSSRAIGRIGGLRQTLSLPIALSGAVKLRLDPADRPGIMQLGALHIVAATGEVVWRWTGRPDGFAGAAGVVAVGTGFGRRGVALGLLTSDASLELDLGEVELPAGCRLECEVDWPMSTDTLALSEVYRAEAAEREAQLRSHIGELEAEVKGEHAAKAALETLLAEERAERAAAEERLRACEAQLRAWPLALVGRALGRRRP